MNVYITPPTAIRDERLLEIEERRKEDIERAYRLIEDAAMYGATCIYLRKETKILFDPEIRSYIRAHGFEYTTYPRESIEWWDVPEKEYK